MMLDLSKDYDAILNDIDGFLIIDTQERLVYISDNLLNQINRKKEDVIGRRIRDIIPTNRAHRVLETGKKQIGVMYFVGGYTIVSNGYPIYKDGVLAGAFEYDIFANIGVVEDFLERVENIGDSKISESGKREWKKAKYSIEDIVGSGEKATELKAQIKSAAKSSSTVMITGETGSGKELAAHAIHRLSQRSLFHFVRLNCASIPTELFESELFGYEEGSFTGAKKGGKPGKIEIADNGTLFLDEIDNLSLGMQAKILRFLQEKEVLRVGGDFPVPVNTRIIVATNQPAQYLLDSGLLRKDLFYRLNVIEINVPPLRERLCDIPELTDTLITDLNAQSDRVEPITGINRKALLQLARHSWPGNIRELRNVLERAFNRCDGDVLKVEHFDDFMINRDKNPGEGMLAVEYDGKSLKEIKRQAEMRAISNVMAKNSGNFSKSAKELAISRQMLHKKMKLYGEK